jgi:hypothetical protein
MAPWGGMTDFSAARISDHARTAMARRGISEAQVREALRAPQAVVPADRPGRVVVQGPVTLGDRRRLFCASSSKWVWTRRRWSWVYTGTQFRRYGAKP